VQWQSCCGDTNDRAVGDQAEDFDLKTAAPVSLAAIIDAADSPADGADRGGH